MPTMPPTFRNGPVRTKRERDREHDERRRKSKPWRSWYNTAAWQARRQQQLASQPLCERCLAEGLVTEATVANHRVPHRGNWDLFARGDLESLCKPHHDRDAQREERRADRPGGGSKV